MKRFLLTVLSLFLSLSFYSCAIKKDETDKMIDQMTLREKAAQMLMPSIRYETFYSDDCFSYLTELNEAYTKLIAGNGFGGIILFGGNFVSYDQSIQLIDDIKRVNKEAGHLPLFIAIDHEGGSINRIPFSTILSGNLSLGAANKEETTYRYASIIGEELFDLGINLDLAPVADINNNPENPVIGIRSFSDDPKLTANMTRAFIQGLHSQNVLSTLKHFPGHGDTSSDSHYGLPRIDKTYEEIMNFELEPFKAGIEEGSDLIMTAHIQFPAIEEEKYKGVILPATLSEKIIGGILRNDLGFDSVVITDSLNMDAIRKYFSKKDVARLAINAGCDILLMPVNERVSIPLYIEKLENYITMICDLVEEGQIKEETIDAAVRRILKLKKDKGLFEESEIHHTNNVGSLSHQKEGLAIAKSAITLVENNDALPIKEKEKVLVLVSNKGQYNSLIYLRDLLADQGLLARTEDMEIYCFSSDTNKKDFSKNILPKLKKKDKVLLVSQMDSAEDLSSTDAYIFDLTIKEAKDRGIKTILLSSQLPYDLTRYKTDAKAACYYAARMYPPLTYTPDVWPSVPLNLLAAGLVLYGQENPQGSLPLNIPELIENEKTWSFSSQVLYPKGYSITY